MTATTVTKATTTKTTTAIKPSKPSKTRTTIKSKTMTLIKSTTPLPPPLLASARGTPFERAVWQLTYQIPAGCFSTYALLAAHLKSSPRAVGNALRRNPFAPEIPCHRVIATGGTLGGFKGKIGRRDGEGITLAEKRTLLRREGVKLEGDGEKLRVLGTAFRGFV